jgi:hypothetical protein
VPGGYSKEESGRISDKGLKGRSPQQVFAEKEKRMENTKAQGMRKKMGGGMMKKYNKGGQMLKGGQKKLDKNKDGKISGEDFKLIRREKPEMKPIKKAMGGEMKKGYGAARQSGMGLQDENLVPGKSMDYYKDLM